MTRRDLLAAALAAPCLTPRTPDTWIKIGPWLVIVAVNA